MRQQGGEDTRQVQEQLGHRHVTTTQIYDKRRRQTAEGASHHVPIRPGRGQGRIRQGEGRRVEELAQQAHR